MTVARAQTRSDQQPSGSNSNVDHDPTELRSHRLTPKFSFDDSTIVPRCTRTSKSPERRTTQRLIRARLLQLPLGDTGHYLGVPQTPSHAQPRWMHSELLCCKAHSS